MIVNRRILLSLLVMASLAGSCAGQVSENYGVVEAANDLGNLGTFVRAITQADMIDRLNDEGTLNLRNDTYVVFAPNDAAFSSLPSQAWNSIMANEDDLNTLLEYHIVEDPDVDDIRDLRDIDTLEALDGRDINLSSDNGVMTVNGARVLESRMYSDGIVYVIDRVLLPDDDEFLDKYNLRDLRTGYVTARTNETTADEDNYGIIEVINDLGNLNTFERAITQADMIDRLNDEGTINLQNDTYVVFAPNDAAFNALPSGTLNSIMANEDDLNTLLEYHIVENPDVDNIRDLRDIDILEALDGRDINLSSDNGVMTVNGARVLESRMYSDGIVYVIDRVLLPDDDEFLDEYNLRDLRTEYVTARDDETTAVRRADGAIVVSELDEDEDTDTTRVAGTANITERRNMSAAERDFIEALRAEDDLSIFTQALETADLNGDFYDMRNLTIFAPNDQAFSVIPEETREDLLDDRDDLRRLLRYHIVDRSNITDWNTTRGSIETLDGDELMIDRTDGEFTVNNATVLRTKYYNDSVIYVINRVLLPDDDEFLDRYDLRGIEERYELGTRVATADEEDDTGLPPQPMRNETTTTRTGANGANLTDEEIYEERLRE